jgi:hypothetical protein
MTLIELKKSLHEQIDACDDIKLLRKVEKILKQENIFNSNPPQTPSSPHRDQPVS